MPGAVAAGSAPVAVGPAISLSAEVSAPPPDEPTPTPTEPPQPTPSPSPSPVPVAAPAPSSSTVAWPPPPPPAPGSLYLFASSGFRYQDPNFSACTSTSVMDMLNFIALQKQGGANFRWQVTTSGAGRDSILAWERSHDTLYGGTGSDPHGLRNALNFYGWGSDALWAGQRAYDDFAFGSYHDAVKAAVRAMARYRKPVAILAWRGRHAQMLTGYYGLSGDPYATSPDGRFTNAFTVAGVYLTDPLKADAWVHKPISYASLQSTSDSRFRYGSYVETDSPYDDPYTPGTRRSRDEWYAKWVIVAPVR